MGEKILEQPAGAQNLFAGFYEDAKKEIKTKKGEKKKLSEDFGKEAKKLEQLAGPFDSLRSAPTSALSSARALLRVVGYKIDKKGGVKENKLSEAGISEIAFKSWQEAQAKVKKSKVLDSFNQLQEFQAQYEKALSDLPDRKADLNKVFNSNEVVVKVANFVVEKLKEIASSVYAKGSMEAQQVADQALSETAEYEQVLAEFPELSGEFEAPTVTSEVARANFEKLVSRGFGNTEYYLNLAKGELHDYEQTLARLDKTSYTNRDEIPRLEKLIKEKKEHLAKIQLHGKICKMAGSDMVARLDSVLMDGLTPEEQIEMYDSLNNLSNKSNVFQSMYTESTQTGSSRYMTVNLKCSPIFEKLDNEKKVIYIREYLRRKALIELSDTRNDLHTVLYSYFLALDGLDETQLKSGAKNRTSFKFNHPQKNRSYSKNFPDLLSMIREKDPEFFAMTVAILVAQEQTIGYEVFEAMSRSGSVANYFRNSSNNGFSVGVDNLPYADRKDVSLIKKKIKFLEVKDGEDVLASEQNEPQQILSAESGVQALKRMQADAVKAILKARQGAEATVRSQREGEQQLQKKLSEALAQKADLEKERDGLLKKIKELETLRDTLVEDLKKLTETSADARKKGLIDINKLEDKISDLELEAKEQRKDILAFQKALAAYNAPWGMGGAKNAIVTLAQEKLPSTEKLGNDV